MRAAVQPNRACGAVSTSSSRRSGGDAASNSSRRAAAGGVTRAAAGDGVSSSHSSSSSSRGGCGVSCVSSCGVARLSGSAQQQQRQRRCVSVRSSAGSSTGAGAAPGGRSAASATDNLNLTTAGAVLPSSSMSSIDDFAASTGGIDQERVGILLLNLGGPEKLEDVQPFLYNLFADPDIIRLPPAVRFLQSTLATVLSNSRAPKSMAAYESIGGGSPLRRITDEQGEALRLALRGKGQEAKVYVGMRYWKPFTEDAVAQIKADGITRLVVLPLYPQFSISTSGSSLRLLEELFAEDEYLRNMVHTVIPSWYQRPGYTLAMAELIKGELNNPARAFDSPDEPVIFFSAHGVPVSYVETAGDPYKEEMEECVALIVAQLARIGVHNEHVLAYQSRVGPVEWLKPYTDDTIRELGAQGKSLVAVPVSFVSEHIETLEEMDMEYRELAEESGCKQWGRVPALDTNPIFIQDLADAVIEALPFGETLSPHSFTTAGGVNVSVSGSMDYMDFGGNGGVGTSMDYGGGGATSKNRGGPGMRPPEPMMPMGAGSKVGNPMLEWGPGELAMVVIPMLLVNLWVMTY